MNSRTILATLAATVAGFLAGWLIFGMGLDAWYKHNAVNYEGLYKEMPNMLSLVLAHVVWAVMLVYVLTRMGVNSAKGALLPAAIIAGLLILSMDLFMHAMMNLWENPMIIVVDTLANSVWGGIMGLAAGWVLGRGTPAATS